MITGTKFTLLLALPLLITFILSGKQFIGLWMGEKYVSLSWIILVILTLPQFGAMSQYISGTILFGMAKHKTLAYVAISEAIVNLILSVILVKKYGLVGVAWGTAIPLLLTNTIIIPLYICKKINLKIEKYFKESFVMPVLCSIPFTFIVFSFSNCVKHPTWGILIIQLCTAFITFYVSSFFFCLDSYQREKIISEIKSVIYFKK